MPGIFGVLGCHQGAFDALRQDLFRIWPGCQLETFPGGYLGGHAFGAASALHLIGKDFYIGINGETSSYALIADKAKGITSASSYLEILDFATACRGSVVIVDLRLRVCHFASEHTGTFPLYYSKKNGALLLSSLLKPLARVLNASPDQIGVLEFLFRRYTFGRRTHFEEISRLLPGQVITYDLNSEQLLIREPKISWLEKSSLYPNGPVPSEAVWDTLITAVGCCFDKEGRHGLMMSGGWDSRFLLCAILNRIDSKNICAYSYGDPRSRELILVKEICRIAGVEHIQESLDETLYAPDLLQNIFNRVEHTLFPHWHRAGERLAGMGIGNVSAGVYGEVLGGHYGPGMLLTGMGKISTVGRELLGLPVQCNVSELLRFPKITRKPPFLTKAFGNDLIEISRQINADIELSLQQLKGHKLDNAEQLLEAFIALNRGSRYINQQLLSCRTTLNVSFPFIDINFLQLSSQIPLRTKIHNSVHRNLLQQHGSPLLNVSTAAALAPAFMPILIQEGSRAIRKLYDEIHGRLNKVTGGHFGPSSSDYLRMEFLRNGNALRSLLDDLQCDIWDRLELEKSIAKAAEHKEEQNMLTLSYKFLTIYTTDLMLR